MAEQKYSRQREALINELRSRHDHPTAEVLYQKLREEYPKISLGTVYRNLALLCDMGKIQKVSHTNDGDRYDGVINPHSHFICSCCGKIIDIETNDKIIDDISNNGIAEINSQTTIYYGLCKACK